MNNEFLSNFCFEKFNELHFQRQVGCEMRSSKKKNIKMQLVSLNENLNKKSVLEYSF